MAQYVECRVQIAIQSSPIDNVAYQIGRVALDRVKEVHEQIGVAAGRAKMDVGNPDGTVALLGLETVWLVRSTKAACRHCPTKLSLRPFHRRLIRRPIFGIPTEWPSDWYWAQSCRGAWSDFVRIGEYALAMERPQCSEANITLFSI